MAGRLAGNAIARRRAQTMAERDRIAARPDLSLFAPVAPPLPAERWHTGPRAQFGYPWGWVEFEPGLALEAGTEVECVLQAERPDEAVVHLQGLQIGACAPTDLLDAAAWMEEERAKLHQFTRYAPMCHLRVGGELALAIQLSGRAPGGGERQSVLTEVFTVHRGFLYLIVLSCPEENHLAYLQVLWTVLGTWSWR